MKKIIITICLVLAVCFTLAACSSSGNGNQSASTTEPVSETVAASASDASTQPVSRTPQPSVNASTTSATPVVIDPAISATASYSAQGGADIPVTSGSVSTGGHKLGSYNVKSSGMLHVKPDASSTELIAVTSGDSLKILAIQGNWGYVCDSASTWGWIDMNTLTADGADGEAASTYKAGSYTVNTQSSQLTVRTKPEAGADGIDGLDKGTSVTVLAVQGNWGYITVSSTSGGWINMEYLK